MDLAGSLNGKLHEASQFAKFLVAPYCLDLELYIFFCNIMDDEPPEQKVFLVSMEGHVFPQLLHTSPVYIYLIYLLI